MNQNNRNRTIELDRHGKPTVKWYTKLSSQLLLPSLVATSFLLPFTFAFQNPSRFLFSPLVKWTGTIVGFVASCISSVFAYVIMGIGLGDFDFASKVYHLCQRNTFTSGLAMVFLLLPFTGLISRITNKSVQSIKYRSIIALSLLVLISLCISDLYNYPIDLKLHSSKMESHYYFLFICLGTIFFLIFLVRWCNIDFKVLAESGSNSNEFNTNSFASNGNTAKEIPFGFNNNNGRHNNSSFDGGSFNNGGFNSNTFNNGGFNNNSSFSNGTYNADWFNNR